MLNNNRKILATAAISAALVCLLVYLRALSCDFTNLDDPAYVINNSSIRRLDWNLLVSAFTRPHYFGWLPLTTLSFAIDYHFWQLNPLGYHLTNLLLHACNVGLVVLIADKLLHAAGFPRGEGRYFHVLIPFLAGLLWGIHPLRVESVAWVSQRKDVLNGILTLGAVLFYLRHTHCRDTEGEVRCSRRNYYISLGLFACSLMAKQVSVVLPLLLLVVDWYPLQRLGRGRVVPVLLEKLPYLSLSVAVSCLTIYFASFGNVMITAEDFPYYARALVSGNALFEYCRFFVYPFGIQPYFVIGDELQTAFVVKSVAVVAVTCYCMYAVRRRPYLGATWVSFLLPLLPVLAFTQTADDTALASRYTYLPGVPLCIAAAALFAHGHRLAAETGRRWLRGSLIAAAVAVLLVYGGMTLHLLAAWKNPATLWTRQIEIQPLGRAYIFRGLYYFSVARYDAALEDIAASLRIAQQAGRGDVFNLLAYRGEALRALGRHKEAVEALTAAITLSAHPQYYYFRGSALRSLGRLAEAERDFRLAGAEKGPIRWFPTRYMQAVELEKVRRNEQ